MQVNRNNIVELEVTVLSAVRSPAIVFLTREALAKERAASKAREEAGSKVNIAVLRSHSLYNIGFYSFRAGNPIQETDPTVGQNATRLRGIKASPQLTLIGFEPCE